MIPEQMGYLKVRVTPGARETAINGWQDGILRLRVREKAEKGRANDAVARLLAAALGVAPSAVRLTRGATSREKLFEVADLSQETIRERLGAPMI
jgi:uncharacterized protein YggU (UPF0235/DUF167 family)